MVKAALERCPDVDARCRWNRSTALIAAARRGHYEILKYLAKNIGDRLETLGKTIIFVALKEQAKKLAKYLKNHNKVDQDDVSYVYSGLEKEKVQSDYKEIKTNAQKIEDFKLN